jgi:hypothetical protein
MRQEFAARSGLSVTELQPPYNKYRHGLLPLYARRPGGALRRRRTGHKAIVTHNMRQAARASDDTALLYPGGLIEFDDTETIFTHPAKKQTEDYVTGRFG